MLDSESAINKIRRQIDEIDSNLLRLFQERLHCAKEIGRIKAGDNMPCWDPLRERQILDRLMEVNKGVFPEEPLLSIFHEIITTCRLSEKEVNVAYLGPEATFSHLAGLKHFGHAAIYMPTETIEDIFIEVERDRCQYGMVPVENSIEGSVTPSLDAFMRYRVKICGEVYLKIQHHLVNVSGNIHDIRKVVSHSQPLAQCRQWLKKNMPLIPCETVMSTGVAAQMATRSPEIAAITSSLAVKTYSLQVLAERIEDYGGNTTRFLVIGRKSPSRSGNDKTSLLLGLLDQPGALNNVLGILAAQAINLTKIESRPVKDVPWKYLFFIDFFGHIEDQAVKTAYDRLKGACSYYEWLGSYPSAPNAET